MADTAKRRSQAAIFKVGEEISVSGDYFFPDLPTTHSITGTILNLNPNGTLKVRWHCDQTRSDVLFQALK